MSLRSLLPALLLSMSVSSLARAESSKKITWADVPTQVLRGEKPEASPRVKLVLLDFWASWCEPCRQSLPFYDELQRKYAAKGVLFIAVSADEQEKEAREFLKNVKFSFPAVWDKDRHLVNKLQLQAIPALVAMKADGEVLGTERGFTVQKRRALPGKIDAWLAK
ncbi:MAG: TlpA family protein disulfide reductase [Bdellovibrionaceae bacterium]|nr:TlpA family protein disulfide reductase [Pseudobdellovibrionaceae bacterium]MBX3033891.1 TlpA family protein disulfide reductase [Pseudobdellovibrionaceae bacterium]